MTPKLFIVEADNQFIYHALRSALANEPDVEIIFDRRKRAVRWDGTDRRTGAVDVRDRIRSHGFAAVRPSPRSLPEGNIRWA